MIYIYYMKVHIHKSISQLQKKKEDKFPFIDISITELRYLRDWLNGCHVIYLIETSSVIALSGNYLDLRTIAVYYLLCLAARHL
jgi:hypothetical protein